MSGNGSAIPCREGANRGRRAPIPGPYPGGMATFPPRRQASPRRPGERLVTVGAVLFGAGALATVATLVPLLVGASPLPTAAYLLAVVLTPLGFALALAGLVRGARARRRPRQR